MKVGEVREDALDLGVGPITDSGVASALDVLRFRNSVGVSCRCSADVRFRSS